MQPDSTIFPNPSSTITIFDDSTDSLYMELDNEAGTLVRVDSIDGAINDFNRLYQNVVPYIKIPMLGGDCYRWSDEFIYNCLLAMSTDRLTQFTEQELQAWYTFVNFENYHSTSARDTDANGTACGCTIPDAENKSYVVAACGAILTTELCQDPTYEIELEAVWYSLDQAFMSLYRCEAVNNCGSYDTMDDSTCPNN